MNAIYLPSGLDWAIAEAVVREANLAYGASQAQDSSVPPFAILVDDSPSHAQDIPVVSRSEAIRYRQGDRLAVIPATSVDIASFDGTFREVIGPAFPATGLPGFETRDLAARAASLLAEAYGNPPAFDHQSVAVLLRKCMGQAATLLTEEREGAASWTRDWFELVDRALGALDKLASHYKSSRSAESYQDMVEKNAWAAFGLPRPTATHRPDNASNFIQVLNERWSSEDSIALLTREAAIANAPGATALGRCAEVGWAGLDDAVVREPSALTGLQAFVSSQPERIVAFSGIDQDIFYGADEGDAPPIVLTADGIDAGLAPESLVQVPVLSSSLVDGQVLTESFLLDLSTLEMPSESLLARSKVRVRVESPASATVTECSKPQIVGARLRVALCVRLPLRKTLRVQKVRVRVEVPHDDPLHGYLKQRAADIHVLPPVDSAALLVSWADKKRTKLSTTLAYEGPDTLSSGREEVEDQTGSVYSMELKPSKSYRIAFYSPAGDPRASTLLLEPADRKGWWLTDVPPDVPAEIVDRGTTWQFEPATPSAAPQSLLVSAMLGVAVDPKDPEADTTMSLRGQLESVLASHVDEPHFLEGLGHVALPREHSVHVESLRLADGSLERQGPLLVPASLGKGWSALVPTQPPGPAWQDTRDAFLEAWRDCEAELARVVDNPPGRSTNWPSKRSTRALSKRPELVRAMLRAFTAMVNESQNEDPVTRFVSVFPFSASGWRNKAQAGECQAVLLSPWHPLRLAWLSGVEETLRVSERAQALVGCVEGWKFPFVAPAPRTFGRMIAVPTDGGHDDIFVAWSLMLPLAFGDTESLMAPSRLAGLAMPGSSASGLTGSAADAAVRDFRRVNGHLSSVTIDLASSSESQRMVELDQSVLRAAELWSAGPNPVTGVDVRDSLHRRGDLPRQQVTKLLRDGLATSISWSRYRPAAGDPIKSNLRLLQDSGVRLSQHDKPGERRGALGAIPLRRFEGPAQVSANQATLQPSVNGSSAFAEALRAVEERNGEAPVVTVALQLSQLMDDHADWSISGDSFVSATILATSLARQTEAGKGRRMLWEWRPPFLNPGKGSPLNRRPYASVMRVGQQLIARISEHLLRVDPDTPVQANDVFGTLGSQGIGLSSLLTMGGHHASGAIGFYLTLRMLELASPPPGCLQAVMPIDSCRSFLDVLAPEAKASETRRQADLLVIRATPQRVTLIPVEIKMYGLDSATAEALPTPGPRFEEALDQLKATTTLLRGLMEERQRLEDDDLPHERALWDNALATLLEASLRLSPGSAHDDSLALDTLQSVVAGSYDLSIGRPLITFYQHASSAPREHRTYKIGDAESHHVPAAYGALAARPNLVLCAVAPKGAPNECEPLLSDWSSVVQWSHDNAVGRTTSGEAADSGPHDSATHTIEEQGVQHDPPPSEQVSAPDSAAATAPVPANSPAPRADRGTRQETVTVDEDLLTGHRPRVGTDSGHPSPIGGDAPQVVSAGQRVPSSPAGGSPAPHGSTPTTGTSLLDPEDGLRFAVGSFSDSIADVDAEYWPGNTATTQLNMGIVGDLGTGKTQLLKALLVNLRHVSRRTQPRAVNGLVFDYKRDFQDTKFIDSVGADVWSPYRLPLNVLDLHGDYSGPAAYKRAAGFASMLERIYAGIGPVQRGKLIQVIRALFAESPGTAPTLGQVLNRYQEDGANDAVSSILEGFVLSEIFSEDRGTLISLEEAMEDRLLVLDLNSFGADHKTKNALVVLFLDMFYESMKRSTKPPFRTSSSGTTIRQVTSYLLVDEASNIMDYDFPVLESLLKEGREFGVGTILSSQYLSHFKSKNMNFAESLSTWFVHKVPNVTPAQLSSLGIVGSAQGMADRIKQLQVHESLFKSDLSEARFISETPFWRLIQDEAMQTY